MKLFEPPNEYFPAAIVNGYVPTYMVPLVKVVHPLQLVDVTLVDVDDDTPPSWKVSVVAAHVIPVVV